jgi:putative exporter of polyketide antibiotics
LEFLIIMPFSSFYKMQKILHYAIAAVWLINGLYCKVLGFVPRHQQIVAQILGEDYAFYLTKAIGLSEILVFVWILSRIKSKWCAYFQIFIVLTMNVIEFCFARNLLLFGGLNFIFATLFVSVVAYNSQFSKE